MGMSIEEAIEIINHYLDYPKEKVREALLLSIDTMRKYQKTEQDIVKPYLEAIEAEAIKYSGTGEREIQAYGEGLLKAIEIIKKLFQNRRRNNGM